MGIDPAIRPLQPARQIQRREPLAEGGVVIGGEEPLEVDLPDVPDLHILGEPLVPFGRADRQRVVVGGVDADLERLVRIGPALLRVERDGMGGQVLAGHILVDLIALPPALRDGNEHRVAAAGRRVVRRVVVDGEVDRIRLRPVGRVLPIL